MNNGLDTAIIRINSNISQLVVRINNVVMYEYNRATTLSVGKGKNGSTIIFMVFTAVLGLFEATKSARTLKAATKTP